MRKEDDVGGRARVTRDEERVLRMGTDLSNYLVRAVRLRVTNEN